MACEVSVKIKDSVKSLTQKTKVYEDITACYTDEKIDELISKAQKNFSGDPLSSKVTVTIKLIED
jgi:hypothetical protein